MKKAIVYVFILLSIASFLSGYSLKCCSFSSGGSFACEELEVLLSVSQAFSGKTSCGNNTLIAGFCPFYDTDSGISIYINDYHLIAGEVAFNFPIYILNPNNEGLWKFELSMSYPVNGLLTPVGVNFSGATTTDWASSFSIENDEITISLERPPENTVVLDGVIVNVEFEVTGIHDTATVAIEFLALNDGNLDYTITNGEAIVYAAVSCEGEMNTPYRLELLGNFPNPFNPETTISYSLDSHSEAILTVYNIRGQMVRQLVKTWQQAGIYSVIWDGSDEGGNAVASGVYFYSLKVGNTIRIGKCMILK